MCVKNPPKGGFFDIPAVSQPLLRIPRRFYILLVPHAAMVSELLIYERL